MSQQNVYDDPVFFEGYRRIRENAANANILVEKPALFSLLPDLKDASILDLGCGYGENCRDFLQRGASRVLGIDISEKMLEIARRENGAAKVEYRKMPMEAISELDERFDLIVSSLAIHYLEDFAGLAREAFRLLKPNGLFIFSQENPLNTCFSEGSRWTKDEAGKVLFANVSNYCLDGRRESKWFIEKVIKYHRSFSSILNSLIDARFTIERLLEPLPGPEAVMKDPEYGKDIHKPDFLLVKARKREDGAGLPSEGFSLSSSLLNLAEGGTTMPADDFLSKISAPARRALEGEGITTLAKLSQYSEGQILKLHGVGPSTIPKLAKELADKGLSFRR